MNDRYRIIAEVKRQAAEIERLNGELDHRAKKLDEWQASSDRFRLEAQRLTAELAGQSKAATDWREAAKRHMARAEAAEKLALRMADEADLERELANLRRTVNEEIEITHDQAVKIDAQKAEIERLTVALRHAVDVARDIGAQRDRAFDVANRATDMRPGLTDGRKYAWREHESRRVSVDTEAKRAALGRVLGAHGTVDASLEARAKIAMLAHDASPPAVFRGGPWENAAPECHAAWIAVVRAVDASRPGLTEEEVRPRSRPYIAEQRQRERSQVYADFEKMGQLESDVIEWLSANYEPLKRRALEASRASRGTPAPGHVSVPRAILERLVDATAWHEGAREAREQAKRILQQATLAAEPARTDPEAARQLADARAEHDQLDAKFRSYDGGDRPQSPPASLIRDLRAAEERVRELEAAK